MYKLLKLTTVIIFANISLASTALPQANENFWTIGHYVNAFGDKTDNKFITNSETLRGKFSNSATEGADLRIKFLINDARHILIQLYEYDGNNPVKGIYLFHNFTILVQNDQKEVIQLVGRIHQGEDRLVLINDAAIELHNILMKGGTIKFRIIDHKSPSTKYNFDIVNTDNYGKAYELLKEN